MCYKHEPTFVLIKRSSQSFNNGNHQPKNCFERERKRKRKGVLPQWKWGDNRNISFYLVVYLVARFWWIINHCSPLWKGVCVYDDDLFRCKLPQFTYKHYLVWIRYLFEHNEKPASPPASIGHGRVPNLFFSSYNSAQIMCDIMNRLLHLHPNLLARRSVW